MKAALLVIALAACGSVGDSTSPDGAANAPDATPACTPGHDTLYVTSYQTGGVEIFDCIAGHDDSTVGGTRLIAGPSTGLTFGEYGGLAYDRAHDALYVAEHGDGTVRVWDGASAKDGDVAPTRIIQTGAFYLRGIALDATRDVLYILDGNGNQVKRYAGASTLDGAATAAATITRMFAITPTIDEPDDRLYVATGSDVGVYDGASAITGTDAQPIRVFTPSSSATSLQMAAVDPDQNTVYIASDEAQGAVYAVDRAAQAVGTVTPSRTLIGGMTNVAGVQVIDDRMFAITDGGDRVFEFAPASSADGDAAPVHQYLLGTAIGAGDGFLYVP